VEVEIRPAERHPGILPAVRRSREPGSGRPLPYWTKPVAALLAVATLWACTIHHKAWVAAAAVKPASSLSVCVLFFDGLSKEALDRVAAAGDIPALKAEVLDRGLSVDTAVSSIPSETYPNLAALQTGLFPGHHGIPANIWLDRRLQIRESHTNIFRSYSSAEFLTPASKTIFEMLPPDSVAVTTPMARGVTVHSKNLATVVASYLRNDWAFLDRKTIDDLGDAYHGALSAGTLPSIAWGHLLGPDEVAHFEGPDSEASRAIMRAIDRSFTRLVRRLKRWGIYDRVLFVVLGDHGHAGYTRFVAADELVHRVLYRHPTVADCTGEDCVLVPFQSRRAGFYDVGDAQVVVGAYRGAMIWLATSRPPEEVPRAVLKARRKAKKRKTDGVSPPVPPRSEFAAALSSLPEIRLVVTRGPESGWVDVYGPSGRAEAHREELEDGEKTYTYRLLEGSDPLGFPAALLGHPLSAAEWLAGTAATEYPDLPVQAVEFFDSPRAPDVLVSPIDGVGFRAGRLGGHGALSRVETVVPLVFAGPGVRAGRLYAARTLDLTPTLLSYLGVPYDATTMDGRSLGILTEPLGPPAPLPAPDSLTFE
jgi:hypothetical protein